MNAVRAWHARGVDVVCTRYACGMRVVCVWYTCGIHEVYTWFACGMHVVCTWCACGMYAVCTGYARGMHVVCTQYALDMHVVCTQCAHTFSNSDCTFANVHCSIGARASVKLAFWCITPSKAPSVPTPQRMRQPDRNDSVWGRCPGRRPNVTISQGDRVGFEN